MNYLKISNPSYFYLLQLLLAAYINPLFSSTISYTAGFIFTFLSCSGVSQTNPTNRSSFCTIGFFVPRYSTRYRWTSLSIVGCPVLCRAVKENDIVLMNFFIRSMFASRPVSSAISRRAASAGASLSLVCHFGRV